MSAFVVTTPDGETTLRRFSVAERLQRGLGRIEETEAERCAWIADSNALIREHLTFMKVRGGRLPGEWLRILDAWPLEPWEVMQQATADRLAALLGYLAAGGGLQVVTETFIAIGAHIEKAARAGDSQRLQTAQQALRLLGKTFGEVLDSCMCERRRDGRGGLRLVEWAQRKAEQVRQRREAARGALEDYDAACKERRRAQLVAARAKAAASRAALAAAIAALEAEAGIPDSAKEGDA
ncbi:hypothetical protein EV699_114134 [Plasticicumulans lactativorans]|uniref:Uncharacterized protein n=1 Tax=Plasticicumulans lactativorans TaxID=1133106 RepID=A0A4R2LCC0_9GAMM|nr:hypothetical protein [Plasticicumulans lactativorans]TCO80488.1 hypothetical protein EV699_114134 [Plasticicumulans lactativorans]